MGWKLRRACTHVFSTTTLSTSDPKTGKIDLVLLDADFGENLPVINGFAYGDLHILRYSTTPNLNFQVKKLD